MLQSFLLIWRECCWGSSVGGGVTGFLLMNSIGGSVAKFFLLIWRECCRGSYSVGGGVAGFLLMYSRRECCRVSSCG